MCKDNDNFEDVIRGVGVDTEPRASHKAKLRWQMLSAFNKAAQREASKQMIRRKIMRNPITKLTITLAAAAVIVIMAAIGIQRSNAHGERENNVGGPSPYSTPAPEPGPDMVPGKSARIYMP